MIIEAYTDGSSEIDDKGKIYGGWAYKLIYGEHTKVESGSYKGATNNMAEMMAVYKAMQAIKDKSIRTEVYCDSQYVVNIITDEWSPKKNMEFWSRLFRERDRFRKITFKWIKGHADNKHNIEVDAAAYAAMKRAGKKK